MILEKCEELRQLCFNAKRQCVILSDAKGSENGTSIQFWNTEMKNTDMVNNIDDKNKCINNMLLMCNMFVYSLTERQCFIASNKK